MPRDKLIQIRRGTTTQWNAADTASTADPTRLLAAGEPGRDTTTGVLKIGDGVTKFADLKGYLDEDDLLAAYGPGGTKGLVSQAQGDLRWAQFSDLSQPPTFQMPKADLTYLTQFQSGHGFTVSGAGATIADDTADYRLGSQSVKVTTGGTAANTFVDHFGMSAMNLSGKEMAVLVKVDDVKRLDFIQLYLGTGNLAAYKASRSRLGTRRPTARTGRFARASGCGSTSPGATPLRLSGPRTSQRSPTSESWSRTAIRAPL